MEIQGRFEHMSISSAPRFKPSGAPIYQPSGTHPPARITPKSYEEQLFGLASAALNYYNSNHQCRFELVDPLYMEDITSWRDPMSSYYHLSFIARSKDSSRKLKLFFAEVCSGQIVKACTPVEPDPPPWKLATREESAKKLLCETYIFKDTVQELYPEEDKELRKIINGYAVKALNCYGRREKRVFELLEPVASVRFRDTSAKRSQVDAVVWVHVTFMARNKDHLCIDASPELFFAELNVDFGWVNTCINMTQTGSGSSEAETSCAVCRKFCPMFHPEGGYVAGLYKGTFADAQVKDRSWGAKVELQEKVGTSSNAAGVQAGELASCSSN